jgi:dTDP-4-dehydrorhamnose 3,5-epimerase
MKIIKTRFKNLLVIKNHKFIDSRGYFREVLVEKNIKKRFLFNVVSVSKKNVIRGLHIQRKIKQELFVSVIKGKIFDILLDLRKNSKTYGKSIKNILSEKNATSLYVPAGFAHGFCGMSKENIVLYGITNYRSKKNEVGILWNDKDLKIKWPTKKPKISKKDKKNITFQNFNNFYL